MRLWNHINNFTLQTKLVLLIMGLFLIVVTVLGTSFNSILTKSVEAQIGKSALNVAEAVASIPSIKSAFNEQNPAEIIQPLADEIRLKSGAEFIVVGNKESIRYSHPNEDKIGKKMVGGDNYIALNEGTSYISKSEGTLGPSIRGKVPIFDNNGEIVGLVSVGILNTAVHETAQQYENQIILFVILLLGVSIIGAFLISKEVKRAIFGLEPKQIGRLFQERSAILESVHEGIIAINDQGYISTINEAAYKILNINTSSYIAQSHILDLLPETKLLDVLRDGKNHYNQEIIINNNPIIVSRVPIRANGKITGVVASFQKKTYIEQLSRELSQVQQYAGVLRSQTHEYANKLYTISGLIQLESYQEALKIINKEANNYQDLIQFLLEAVPDKLISAILLGKYNRAHELQVDFVIDKDSSLRDLPSHIQREKLVTILGNLLDNAFEAILDSGSSQREVHLFMTDLGNDFIFEIEDSGNGLSEEDQDLLFTRGFSTKQGTDRGHGLFLVDQALQYLNGYITISESELGGLAFLVVIPKGGV
ncbi:sensor histidine kinase [Sporosarcina sp.]|uniref:ATP-binding protein n=1 Tax=Sporosarcina sp. TaxID=49982 RepID=UPI00261CAC8D|nr:sensor histidine kinase [Sporosarcina sp.]